MSQGQSTTGFAVRMRDGHPVSRRWKACIDAGAYSRGSTTGVAGRSLAMRRQVLSGEPRIPGCDPRSGGSAVRPRPFAGSVARARCRRPSRVPVVDARLGDPRMPRSALTTKRDFTTRYLEQYRPVDGRNVISDAATQTFGGAVEDVTLEVGMLGPREGRSDDGGRGPETGEWIAYDVGGREVGRRVIAPNESIAGNQGPYGACGSWSRQVRPSRRWRSRPVRSAGRARRKARRTVVGATRQGGR